MALPKIRAAIAAITKIGNEEVAVHTFLVSGTLRALKRKMNMLLKEERNKSVSSIYAFGNNFERCDYGEDSGDQ